MGSGADVARESADVLLLGNDLVPFRTCVDASTYAPLGMLR